MTELHPERFVAGGEALARHADGRVVFVRGALPGEAVRVEFVTNKRDWARAETVEILKPSPDRVGPPCEHRLAGCGGCDWMHLSVDAQLAAKASIVEDALRHTAKIASPTVRLGGAVPATAYRTTIRVAAATDGRVGFREGGRNDVVVATPHCLVAHPRLAEVVAQLHADAGVEVTLRFSAATGQLTAHWDPRSGTVRGLPSGTGCGADASLEELVAGKMLQVSAGSFFQSGPDAAELLVATVNEVAPELSVAERLVDAYAGIGLFAACSAPRDSKIVAIESSPLAAEDARHNLADRDADVLTAEVAEAAVGLRPDVVIANPARTGLGKPGVGAIVRLEPPLLVLVSCDPVALARDAALLRAGGYVLEHVTVLDLFPQTHHVEAVSRFTRA